MPGRTGICSDDVVVQDGNAYGNAVNIACQVVSGGHSGSNLLSSRVEDLIKNKPEF